MFKPNHNDLPTESLMKAGDYEAVIEDIRETATQGGTPYISVHVIIRNDVEQSYKNKHVFESLWTSEKAMPYTIKKLNSIDAALAMAEKEYDSVTEWGRAIERRPIKVHIGIKPADKGYEARNTIDRFMATNFPDCRHQFAAAKPKPMANNAPATQAQSFTEINDDDLPF